MSWPTPQDYNEAVQNPSSCFCDSELRKGTPELNALGLPRSDSGTFASVYRLHCGKRDWAVRCFLSEVKGQESRYRALADFIGSDDLDCTVGFEYLTEGILVHNRWYPIVKMEWVSGESLTTFVERNLENPAVILKFAETFKTMTVEMQAAGVAHGDLQHGNLLVIEHDQIRLVDYDGMYVPQMATMKSNELGHPNYQHPERNSEHFGMYLDNFSAWVIYLSLRFIGRDKSLWKRLQGGDECLLLRRRDFQEPMASRAIQMFKNHIADDVRQGTKILLTILDLDPAQVPPLSLANSSSMKLIEAHVPSWFERLMFDFHHWSEAYLQSYETRAPRIHWSVRMDNEIEEARQALRIASAQNPAVKSSKKSGLPDWLRDYLGSEPPVESGQMPRSAASGVIGGLAHNVDPAALHTGAPIVPGGAASGVIGKLTHNIDPAALHASAPVAPAGPSGPGAPASNVAAQSSALSSKPVTAANLSYLKKTILELTKSAKVTSGRKQYERSIGLLTKALSIAWVTGNVTKQDELAHELAVTYKAQADQLYDSHKIVSAAWSYEQAYNNLSFVITLRHGARSKNDDVMMAAMMNDAARCYELDGKLEVAKKCYESGCERLTPYPDQASVVRSMRERQRELAKP